MKFRSFFAPFVAVGILAVLMPSADARDATVTKAQFDAVHAGQTKATAEFILDNTGQRVSTSPNGSEFTKEYPVADNANGAPRKALVDYVVWGTGTFVSDKHWCVFGEFTDWVCS